VYGSTPSNDTVQRLFVSEFHEQASATEQIWKWHKKFKEEGCLLVCVGPKDLDN